MALTEQSVVDKVEVLEDGTLHVRTATRIYRDGSPIAETYHRAVVTPGEPLTGHAQKVADVAAAVWTPAVVAAYAQKGARRGKP